MIFSLPHLFSPPPSFTTLNPVILCPTQTFRPSPNPVRHARTLAHLALFLHLRLHLELNPNIQQGGNYSAVRADLDACLDIITE